MQRSWFSVRSCAGMCKGVFERGEEARSPGAGGDQDFICFKLFAVRRFDAKDGLFVAESMRVEMSAVTRLMPFFIAACMKACVGLLREQHQPVLGLKIGVREAPGVGAFHMTSAFGQFVYRDVFGWISSAVVELFLERRAET